MEFGNSAFSIYEMGPGPSDVGRLPILVGCNCRPNGGNEGILSGARATRPRIPKNFAEELLMAIYKIHFERYPARPPTDHRCHLGAPSSGPLPGSGGHRQEGLNVIGRSYYRL